MLSKFNPTDFMKLIFFLSALVRAYFLRSRSPLLRAGVVEYVRRISLSKHIDDVCRELSKGELIEVRLPFGAAVSFGQELAGQFLFQIATDWAEKSAVRRTAVRLISALQIDSKASFLLALAHLEEPDVRKAALLGLRPQEGSLYPHSEILQSMLQVERDEGAIAILLELLCVADRKMLPSLYGERSFWEWAIDAENSQLRKVAVQIIGKFSFDATDYSTLLAARLAVEDTVTNKVELVTTLGQVVTDQFEVIEPIASCVLDQSMELALASLNALSAIGPLALSATPHLTLAMLSKEPWRRNQARKTLIAIGATGVDVDDSPAGDSPLNAVLALDQLIWVRHEMPIQQLIAGWPH